MQLQQPDHSKKDDFSNITFMQHSGCCPDFAYRSCFHFIKLTNQIPLMSQTHSKITCDTAVKIGTINLNYQLVSLFFFKDLPIEKQFLIFTEDSCQNEGFSRRRTK